MALQVALDQRPVCPPGVNLPIPVLEHGDKASARQHGLPVARCQSLHCVVSRKQATGGYVRPPIDSQTYVPEVY